MQPITLLGRLSLLLVLIACVCSVLAQSGDSHAGRLTVRATKPKTKAKAPVASKAKAKPKAKPKPQANKTKAKAPAKPKTPAKAKIPAKPKTPTKPKSPAKAKSTTTKVKLKTTAPTKATPTGKSAPAPKNGTAKACPLPTKKPKRDIFSMTDEEREFYYGMKRETHRAVGIRGRSIQKRTNVCGLLELRDQDEAEKGCRATLPISFVVNGGNLVEEQSQTQPDSTACDHIIELQLVADVMKNTGACDAALAMLEAGGFKAGVGPVSLADKMNQLIKTHIVPTVNGKDNVVFLDKNVNQAKNTYVQQFKGKPTAGLPRRGSQLNNSPSAALLKSYLTNKVVVDMTKRSSDALDKKIQAFLNAAQVDALKKLDENSDKRCTGTQQDGDKEKAKKIIAADRNRKDPAFPTVTELWGKISAL
ncbi:hypothetical protein PM082_024348 [Marasmius tenuissimus]|nr:hypothetical protein PM082_024348 [Marasmius tenuissimus]